MTEAADLLLLVDREMTGSQDQHVDQTMIDQFFDNLRDRPESEIHMDIKDGPETSHRMAGMIWIGTTILLHTERPSRARMKCLRFVVRQMRGLVLDLSRQGPGIMTAIEKCSLTQLDG